MLQRSYRRWAWAAALVVPHAPSTFAGEAPRCSDGFQQMTANGVRITCLKSQTVADASAAERLAREWFGAIRCLGGKAADKASSIGDAGDGSWLVTTRFSCAPRD